MWKTYHSSDLIEIYKNTSFNNSRIQIFTKQNIHQTIFFELQIKINYIQRKSQEVLLTPTKINQKLVKKYTQNV